MSREMSSPKKPSRDQSRCGKKKERKSRATKASRPRERVARAVATSRNTFSKETRLFRERTSPPDYKNNEYYERVPLAPISPTSCTGSRRPCPLSLARDLCRRDLCRHGHRRDLFDRHGHRRGQNRAKIRLCQMLRPLLFSSMQKVWLYTAEIFVRTFFVSKKKEKKKRKKTTQRRELSKIRHSVRKTATTKAYRGNNKNNVVLFIHAWWYIMYNKPWQMQARHRADGVRLSVFLQLFPERRLPRK